MSKLRRLSGPEVIHILEGFGFIVHAQAVTSSGGAQNLL
jgi:hypothetical protein